MNTYKKFRPLILYPFFFMFLTGCSYTNKYWEEWGKWNELKNEGVREFQKVLITSKPEGAKVYLDGVFEGNAPISLSLPYPILHSQRTRQQFSSYTPGVIEFLLLSKPKTSAVGSEREDKSLKGNQAYRIEIRKEGHISAKRSFSVPETSVLDFTLKPKPTLFIKPFKIINNFSLSIAQRLFNTLYGKKFGADTSKLSDFDKRYLFPALMEVFEISPDKHSQYSLEGHIIIGKAATEIGILLIEASGRLVAAKKTFMETKDLDNIHQKIEPVIRSIVEAFLNES